MTGTDLSPRPKDDAEAGRWLHRRIEAVEEPDSLRVGNWVLSESPGGNLMASNTNGGSVLLAEVPPADQAPDEIRGVDPPPIVKVRRTAAQSVVTGSVVAVLWDTVPFQVGEWGAKSGSTVDRVVVPEDGRYAVLVSMHWSVQQAGIALIAINGVVLDFEDTSNVAGASGHLANAYQLKEGDEVRALWQNLTGSTRAVGPSGLNPGVFTEMTVFKVGEADQFTRQTKQTSV